MKMLTLLGIFMFSFAAHAISGRTTYQAKIVKPDGYPLEASSVNFRFTILDPAASCVLYIEDYAAVNMTGTGGLISFALGAGTRSYPVSSTTLASVFDNSTVSFPCQSPGIYNPTSVDNRKIVMQFQDSSGWQTLPAMAINAVPYAMYAGKSENAIQLNGKSDTAFVENATLAALNCNVTTHAITFNGVSFSCIPVGSGSSGITSVTTSGTVLTTGGTASAPVISITAATMSSDGYLTSLDYAEFKAKLSASSTQIVNTLGYAPVSGAAVATQINNSQLSGDVSGTVSANSVISVGGKTSSQVSTSVDDTLAATSSATADTIVKRNSSGNFTANDIYANAAKINYVDIYKPSTSFNIRLQAPTSLAANYTLNLPTASGTSGQVLSTDGSGNLSWINPSTGSVVSVSATAPLASTGGSNPTISITQSSSSTDGYLSSTDFNTFNNKQAATSAAIIATLGYTPADNAASGTYAQKANNLSDLTNVVTARTNLGLGTFATASSIDLGSASATGIIAEARLQTQSNVTSGTQYTKVTVDGKGRVTSGAQISSSDVTSALGYTPSNAASAGITTLNGSSSATQTFAIGTSGNSPAFNTAAGTHTLNIPLANTGSVTAGLLSNTDYTTFNNKQTATSAAIIATLGYTPADNAASGTYLVKASDLSDLTNVATARSNLGLGTFATASSVDLGSASATGTLAIARLPSFSGDATIAAASNTIVLSNSGVAAGTYTKLTVDAKGRVTSSAALASSDVTTALGYTPANSASGVTSLNGSVSQTQTFATTNTGTGFGITTANGVHTFAIPLAASSSVVGGLLSNADYTTFTNKQNATSAAIIATLGYTPANATSATQWTTNGSNIYYNTGNIGVGILNPSAKLELASGTASVAPLKFTSGTLLSSAQSGTMEYDGFNYYLTDSTNTRRTIAAGSSAGTIDNASTINSSGNISMVPVGSVIVSSTTASTNSNTGALVVKGGLGVAGNINTAGNLNVSGSSVIDGSLKLSTMTSGSMLFAGANGTVTQDNSNLYWDEANKRLGIGSNSPAQTLSVSGTSYFLGNVGIGTAAPRQKLEVVGTVEPASGTEAKGSFVVAGSTTNGILNMGVANPGTFYSWIQSRHASSTTYYNLSLNPEGGNVGISTTNPSANLHVQGDMFLSPVFYDGNYGKVLKIGWHADPDVHHSIQSTISQGAASGNGLRFFVHGGSSADNQVLALQLAGSGNVGVGTSTPTTKFQVNDGSGRNFRVASDVGTSNVSGIALLASNDADSAYMPMTFSGSKFIFHNGSVGVGTSNPLAALDVRNTASGSNTVFHAFSPNLASGTYTQMRLGMTNSAFNSAELRYHNVGGSGSTANYGALALYSQATPSIVFNGSGNVGIGTATPSAKLHLAAGTSATASLKFTSGTLLTSPQSGTMEYDGFNYYVTDGSNVRRTIATGTSQGNIDNASNINSTGNIVMNPNNGSNSVIVSSTVASTSSNTGALVVNGGLGVAGAVNVSGAITTSSNIQGVSVTATSGMISPYIAGSTASGGALTLDSTTHTNKGKILLAPNGGNVGIGTSSPSAVLQLATATQNIDRIRLTGQEFYQAANSDDVDGVSLLLGANRSGNRQLWIADSAQLTPNTSNTVIRINPNSRDISAFATDGVTSKTLSLNASGGYVGIGNVSPVAPLTVGNSTDRRGYVQLRNDGANGPVLQLYNNLAGGRTYNIYSGFSASGTFAIADLTAGNISRLTITASGHVGVGTDAPQRKLHVSSASSSDGLLLENGTSDSSNLIFHDSTQGVSGVTWNLDSANGALRIFTEPITSVNPLIATNGNERLTILPSGNVGIGTTNPGALLQIGENTVSSSAFRFSPSSDQSSLRFTTNAVANWIQSGVDFSTDSKKDLKFSSINGATTWMTIQASSGNVGIGTAAPDKQLTMHSTGLDNYIHLTSSMTGTTAADGVMIGTGTAGDAAFYNRENTNMIFLTNNTERVRIDNTGNVGIGTTSPNSTLEVSGTLTATKISGVIASIDNRAVVDNPETFNTAGMSLNFKNNSTNSLADGGLYNGVFTIRPYGNAADWTGGPAHQLGFTTNGNIYHRYGSNTTWNTWRRIIETDNAGKVGIGTTSPSYTLDVSGTLRVKGTAYTDGGYTTWTAASDIRLKDIHGNYNRGLDDILGLDIIRFQYKSDNPVGLDSSKEFVGVTAQNLQQGIPEAVTEETNGKLKGYLTINTTPVLWTLVNAVKQLYKQVMERFEGQDRQIASIVESKADKAETDAKIKMLETKAAEVDSLKVENAAKAKEIDALKSYLCSKDPTAPICK